MQQLTRFQLTQGVARSLCDSYATCTILALYKLLCMYVYMSAYNSIDLQICMCLASHSYPSVVVSLDVMKILRMANSDSLYRLILWVVCTSQCLCIVAKHLKRSRWVFLLGGLPQRTARPTFIYYKYRSASSHRKRRRSGVRFNYGPAV